MNLPPLVEAAAELSHEEIARYGRHLLLPDLGVEGQKRLKNSRVLIIGAGGLGSPALLYLAAAGVGTLGIVDFDVVEQSNLQRQIVHGVSDVGQLKTASAARTVAEINPLIQVVCHECRLEAENVMDIFSGYDLIVDGTDNFATRYLVNDACVLAGKPYVWGSIFRFEGQVSVFWENAPGGVGLNYRDLYPEPPPAHLAPSCSEGGVLGILCASIGSVMATEAVKLLTGMGDVLLGRLITFDALDMCYRELPIRRHPDRPSVEGLIDYEYFCGVGVQPQAEVPQISVQEVSDLLKNNAAVRLIDVREKTEWDIVNIGPDSEHIPKGSVFSEQVQKGFSTDDSILVMCKGGARSREVVEQLLEAGYQDVRNVSGGILRWIKEIDPALPGY